MANAPKNTGIDFAALAAGVNANGNAGSDDRPKAKVWMNVGYLAQMQNEDGEKEPFFVSLQQGIPIDTLEPVSTSSGNVSWAKKQSARNDLHAKVMEVAAGLEPGETTIVNLQVEVRRVREEAAQIDASDNELSSQMPDLVAG